MDVEREQKRCNFDGASDDANEMRRRQQRLDDETKVG